MSRHVVVIGAGIVGACCAIELLRNGHRVTIVEPGSPGGEQAASYGNGAWLSPASIVPMSMPGQWRKIAGYLSDPLGPLTIRWSALPGLLPWLTRFLWAGSTVARVEATARCLSALLADCPARHAALAAEAGIPDLIRRTGLLYAYPDRSAFIAEALAWRLRRDNGVAWTELDADALHQVEPGLNRRYTFGIRVDAGAHCVDPGGYVAGLIRHACALGAVLISARVTGFDIRSKRLRAVLTDKHSISCDRAVIAAGIFSVALARKAGDWVSLASERGYHVQIAEPETGPRTPVMPSDGKMANTMTAHGLRAAGQVELARITAPPDWRRADVLLRHLLRAYPGLPRDMPAERVSRWMGHRPSTPDGLPVIGEARGCPDIVYAFGHGHVGLAAGPMTGRIVADIVRQKPQPRLDAYAARRFSRL